MLYQDINSDELLNLRLKKAIGTTETYKFLSDLVSKLPVVTIIIEKYTEQLDEAVSALAHPQIRVVEFQTFVREGVGLNVHAHLFEPLFKPPLEMPITEEASEILPASVILITVKPAHIKYEYLPILQKYRSLFPGFKMPFSLETDIGMIVTGVYSGYPAKWRLGDMNSDASFYKGLDKWFEAHSQLKPGDELIIEAIEPMKRYRLKIA